MTTVAGQVRGEPGDVGVGAVSDEIEALEVGGGCCCCQCLLAVQQETDGISVPLQIDG